MSILKITTNKQFKDFLSLPDYIYKEDSNHIHHIKQEVSKILWDNKIADEVGLWLLYNNYQVVGRIAAFINKGEKGGLGFFECINDTAGAHQLFDTGIKWLQDKGISTVEAPVNYGERDKFWGLMVKGFKNPSYQENYNPRYYQAFFDSYGFEIAIRQSTQEISPPQINVDLMAAHAKRVDQNSNLSIRHIDKHNLDKYAADFTEIYNAAWVKHDHFVPLTQQKVLKMMKTMKTVMREDLIWFTYDKEKPVAFYVSIIEINEIFKYLNGNLNWCGKLRFLYLKWRTPITKIRGLVFGVIPSHQGLGITSGMMMKVFKVFETDPHLATSEL
ncbi:MAG: hypothetical protein ACI9JN_000782, partial [Bacteroidia bacterium]